jgi:hypothetical protein
MNELPPINRAQGCLRVLWWLLPPVFSIAWMWSSFWQHTPTLWAWITAVGFFTSFVALLWAWFDPEMKSVSGKERSQLYCIRIAQFCILQAVLVPLVWTVFFYALCSAHPIKW